METADKRHAEGKGSPRVPHGVRDEPLVPAVHDAAVQSNTRRIGRTVRAWSLSWLLYAFALAMFAPLLGFGLFATSRMIVAERAAEEEQLRRTARMVSASIDRELTDFIEELQLLTAAAELKAGDFAGFHRYASAALFGTGKAIKLVDRDFNQLVNTRVSYGTPLPPFHDLDTARTVFTTGKPAISDLVMSHVPKRLVVNLVVPVTIDGGLRYVLVLSPELGTFTRILAQKYLPDGWFAGVSDRNGRILARSARHQELVGTPISARTKATGSGRSGVIKTTSLEGAVVLHAFLWSDVSGWRTAVWVPLAILEAPARQLWLALAALAVPAFAVSLLAAAFLGRWLARPIAGVANAAVALGRGDPVGYTPCAIAEVNVVGAALAAAASARMAAETALRGRESLLRSATDNAAVGLVMLDCERRYTFANPAYAKILGLPHSAAELIGRGPADVLASVYETQISPHLDRAFAGERVTYELVRPRAGAAANETDHYVVVYDPQYNHEGRVVGVIVTIFDITERKRAEEHVRLLMRELSHRTKNVMAVVQAISWQTARQSLDVEDFEQRFTQRLEALARSHDLLVKRDWEGVVLEDLVRAQLGPFVDSADDRLAVHGPALRLMPVAAQDLGMALHELATNASKYGALSVPTGKIEIRWTVSGGSAEAKRFLMTWRESGGPMVSPPVRTGFGSTVITRTLRSTFKGQAELKYRAEGLSWEFTAPMDHLIAEFQPP